MQIRVHNNEVRVQHMWTIYIRNVLQNQSINQ